MVFLVLGLFCGCTVMGLYVVGVCILSDLVGSDGVFHGFALFPFSLFCGLPRLDLLFGYPSDLVSVSTSFVLKQSGLNEVLLLELSLDDLGSLGSPFLLQAGWFSMFLSMSQ